MQEMRQAGIINPKKLLVNILLALASILICLFALELILQSNIIPGERIYCLNMNNCNSSEVFYEQKWLVSHKNPGGLRAIDKFDPLLGYRLLENLSDEPYCFSTVSSNSRGIRGKKEYDFKKNSNTRIITLGDSFTFGSCVDDNETFSSYLERYYAGSEVLNMGVRGYGTDQMLIRLKSEAVNYSPDIIIVSFINEDLNRNKLSFRFYLKPQFDLGKDKELLLRNVPIKNPAEFEKEMKLKLPRLLKSINDALFQRSITEKNLERAYYIFKDIIKEGHDINSTVIIVYLPSPEECMSDADFTLDIFHDICSEENVTCINPVSRIRQFLANETDKAQYFEEHFRPEIHQLIAEEICSQIDCEGP